MQARLVDADGEGVPSTERLLKGCIVLATPALPNELMKAVDIQRDGATDPVQHGRTPPFQLPKRELNAFLERIAEFKQKQILLAARREQEALETELKVMRAEGGGQMRSGNSRMGRKQDCTENRSAEWRNSSTRWRLQRALSSWL